MRDGSPPVDDIRAPLNRFAVPSLVAAVLLCVPVAAGLALVSLVEIHRSRGGQSGRLFAAMALLISVLVPAVVLSAKYGSPRVLDSCYYTQEEAVGVLRVISFLEEQHKKRHGSYGALEEIGYAPQVDTGPYEYRVERHSKDAFYASATGVKHMQGDLLTVDEHRKVQRTIDLCEQFRRR
ncbi:MAG: hypothetical protein ACO3JL_12495 [Myxococcota bacterium]